MTPSKFKFKSITSKYLFKRDNLFATILVFLLIGVFAKIERALTILDPKEISTKDFTFSDISYMLLNKPTEIASGDTNLIIVNIGNSPRADIVKVIQKLSTYQPRAIGVDINFNKPNPADSVADDSLRSFSQHYKNIIMAFGLDSTDQHMPKGFLYQPALNLGCTDFTLADQNVIRDFEPFITIDKSKYPSFAAAVIKVAAPGAYDTLTSQYSQRQIINYDYKADNFQIETTDDVLKDRSLRTSIAHKIVLVGYLSANKFDCNDKHWTPMKSTIADKALPDMNGLIIHANIICMMLNHTYIHKVPWLLAWLIGFIICWLHMAFFIGYYIERHIWFHFAAKLAQLISATVFIYLGIFAFFYMHIMVDMTSTIVAIVLSVDVLYFYEAGVVWLHRRNGFKTLFHYEGHV